MVVCPKCGTSFDTGRWYKTGGGRYGCVETRCNGCKATIEVYVPFFLFFALLPGLGGLGLIVAARSEVISSNPLLFWLVLVALVTWGLIGPLALFRIFGRIRLL